MPFSESVLNINCATPAWLRMPTPITDTFTTLEVGDHRFITDLLLEIAKQFFGTVEIDLRDREGDIGQRTVRRRTLDDHIDIDVLVREWAKNGRRDTRPVGDLDQRDLRFVSAIRNSANDLVFHDLILIANERAVSVRKGRPDVKTNAVIHRHLDRARL